MTIFDFTDYKPFISQHIEAMPDQGRGQLGRLAVHLRVHPTLVSQVLRGQKDFTLEQAELTADFLGLSDAETDFLLDLVQLARAGTDRLKSRITARISKARKRQLEVKRHFPAVPPNQELSEEQRAIFYSTWYYSALRLATFLPGVHTVDTLSERLSLPKRLTRDVLDFLTVCGLVKEKGGSYERGATHTFVPRESALATRHHTNWRLRGLRRMDDPARIDPESELFFSSPMSIAKADLPKVRAALMAAMSAVVKTVEKTDPDTLACLNMDWFELK